MFGGEDYVHGTLPQCDGGDADDDDDGWVLEEQQERRGSKER